MNVRELPALSLAVLVVFGGLSVARAQKDPDTAWRQP